MEVWRCGGALSINNLNICFFVVCVSSILVQKLLCVLVKFECNYVRFD